MTPIVTGAATPFIPALAASMPFRPASCSAIMFSPTTTASSTTIPKTMISASSVITWKLTPKKSKKRKAPKKEIGTPIATQVANLKSSISTRNRNTRINPRTPFRTMMLK